MFLSGRGNGTDWLRRSSTLAMLGCLGAMGLVATLGCGARSKGEDPPLRGPVAALALRDDAGVPIEHCSSDITCLTDDACSPRACLDGRCIDLPEVECGDSPDPCLVLACQPATGECETEARSTDEDGDGFLASLPGLPSECGNDCDDSSPLALPGGVEVCDGVDNDCDGVIDEGFSYEPLERGVTWVSEGSREAGLGGVVHDGERFTLAYSARYERNQTFLAALSNAGQVDSTTDVALINSDTYAGPLLWTGKTFVVAWEDRRNDDFEIYFNRFDNDIEKLGPDVRLSSAPDFSLNPSLTYTGLEYVVLWQDRRQAATNFQIYGQRLTRQGALIGENVNLTPEIVDAEAPSLALGTNELAFVFNAPFDGRRVGFRTTSFDFSTRSPVTVLSEPAGVGASIVEVSGRYVVAWHEYETLPGDAIWGAVVEPDGEIVVPARRITEPAEFARSHQLISLGDRLLLLFAQYREGSYDLYYRMISPSLEPLTDARQITFSRGDVIGVHAALGPNGLGVAYTDFASGSPQVYFTSLSCR